MALQGDYVTQDTVEHTSCYARITAMHVDREHDKVQYDITLYHNKAARDSDAPMMTIFVAGLFSDYTSISEMDVIKRAYGHVKSMEGMIPDFSAWSDA